MDSGISMEILTEKYVRDTSAAPAWPESTSVRPLMQPQHCYLRDVSGAPNPSGKDSLTTWQPSLDPEDSLIPSSRSTISPAGTHRTLPIGGMAKAAVYRKKAGDCSPAMTQ